METVRCDDLGDDALAAAERFRATYLPQIIARLDVGEDIAVVLPHASTDQTTPTGDVRPCAILRVPMLRRA